MAEISDIEIVQRKESPTIDSVKSAESSQDTLTELFEDGDGSDADNELSNGSEEGTLADLSQEAKPQSMPKYELRTIERDVTDDHMEVSEGLFATEDITQGTRIICELPLVSLAAPVQNRVEELVTKINALPPEKQEKFYSLRPSQPRELQYIREMIDEKIPPVVSVLNKPYPNRTAAEQLVLEDQGIKLHALITGWRVASRFFSHRYSMTTAPAAERANIPAHTPLSGLFIRAAHIRHSCIPNCHAAFNPSTGRLTVHAIKTIKTGTELTLSCIGTHNWYNNAAMRGEHLRNIVNPDLMCRCEVCDAAHSKFVEHERLCAQMHLHAAELQTLIPSLNEQAVGPNAGTVLAAAETKVLRLLAELRKAGCEDIELVRWRNALVCDILPKMQGKSVAVLAHAKTNLVVAVRCWGEDYPDVEGLKAIVRRWEQVVRMERGK